MKRETSIADTHPALADRLRALGEVPCLALPSAGEAADTLLDGAALESITAAFDHRWRDLVQPSWEDRHQAVREKRVQLSTLDARLAEGPALSLDERLQRALLTDEVGAGGDAALAQFRALYADAPADAAVCYGLGNRLLRIGDDAGVALVEQAIERDEQALLPGAAVLRDYYAGRGRDEAARHWHERWLQRMHVLHIAQAERTVVHLNDKFEPHGLDTQQVETLRTQLRAIPNIRKAYLVRKQVEQLVDRPLLVLGFTTKPWWSPHRASRADAARERIAEAVEFPYETLIICVEAANRRFGRKWRFMRGTRVL